MSWADRRAAVAAEEARLAGEARAASEAEARAEMDALEDAEALERLELPDPDSLGPGDDFSVFMGKLVPGRIRRRALRRLWGTNPVLANLDALVEYGEDYTDKATVLEAMATTYQVGKGMLAHLEALAAKAEAREAEAQDAEPLIAAATAEEPVPHDPEDAATAEVASHDEVAPDDIEAPDQVRGGTLDAEAPAPARPRRMRFEVTA